jgi:hypothetical protein
MTVEELIEALKDKDANDEVYLGREGIIHPAIGVKNILDWCQKPTGAVVIVDD